MRGRNRGKARQQFDEQSHATELTATPLAASSPVFGAPAVALVHLLTATGLAASSPVFGTPTLLQNQVLTATALAASSPSFGTPTLVHVAPNPGDGTTVDSGSTNYVVPFYNTLTIEIWGPGAGGQGQVVGAGGCVPPSGNTAATTVTGPGAFPAMTANGGNKGTNVPYENAGPTGGTASGGNNTNTTGGSAGGSHASTSIEADFGGAGGAAPNGGAGGAAVTTNNTATNGNNGTAPGGGGSGARIESAGNQTGAYSTGGASGGYSKSVFVRGVTTGAPAVGASLAYVISPGTAGGNNGTGPIGGSGANGRFKATVA